MKSPPSPVPGQELPARRLAEQCATYLSDSELLSLVLARNLPVPRSLETAQTLLARAGGIKRLARMSHAELAGMPGLGPASVCTVQAAFGLASRLITPEPAARPKLESPSEAAALMRPRFLHLEQEEFHALLLDTKHRLIRDELVTLGLLDRSPIHAREVFRSAVRESCARIILAHNHPSGDPTPSSQDIDSTKSLVNAGRIVGIEVLDHVILGRASTHRQKDYLSFREENLLS